MIPAFSQLLLVFISGVLGSAHCIGMCGGIAATMSLGAGKLRSAVVRQLAWSSGRIVTYCFLGVLISAVGAKLLGAQGQTVWCSPFLGVILCSIPSAPYANPLEQYLALTAIKLGLFFFIGAWFGLWRTNARPKLWAGVSLVGVSLVMSPSNVQMAVFVFGFSAFVLALGSRGELLPKLPEKMGDWSYGLFLYGFPVQQVLAMFGLASAGIAVFALTSTIVSLAFAGLSWFWVQRPALAIGGSRH